MTGLYLLVLASQAYASDEALASYAAFVEALRAAADEVQDATYVMHKSEQVNGTQITSPTGYVKFKAPLSIYMRQGPKEKPDQEVLFREGWNDDRLRVSIGRWVPTLNLSPTSGLAMRKNRHSIHYLSPKVVVQRVMDDVVRGQGRTDIHVKDMGSLQRLGEAVRCFQVQMPKAAEPGFYSDQVELCQSERTQLLVTLKSWERQDGSLQLVEEYGYENLQVNVGLTTHDFSPENDDYRF